MRALVAVTLVLLATLGIACGDSGDDVPASAATSNPSSSARPSIAPSDTPNSQYTLWRWVNVTLKIPADSDVLVSTDGYFSDDKPNGGLAVRLDRDSSPGDDKASVVMLDAETGALVTNKVLDEDRQAIDEILRTISIGELDRSTASWPYNGNPPTDGARQDSLFSYVNAAADTGFHVDLGISDGPGGGQFITINNGTSSGGIVLDSASNKLTRHLEHVQPEDLEAVERWMDTVRVCQIDVAC